MQWGKKDFIGKFKKSIHLIDQRLIILQIYHYRILVQPVDVLTCAIYTEFNQAYGNKCNVFSTHFASKYSFERRSASNTVQRMNARIAIFFTDRLHQYLVFIRNDKKKICNFLLNRKLREAYWLSYYHHIICLNKIKIYETPEIPDMT